MSWTKTAGPSASNEPKTRQAIRVLVEAYKHTAGECAHNTTDECNEAVRDLIDDALALLGSDLPEPPDSGARSQMPPQEPA